MDLSDALKESGVSVGTLLNNAIRQSIEDLSVGSSFEVAKIEKRFNSILTYLSATPQISSDDANDLVSKACVPCLMRLSLREQTDKSIIQCVSRILALLLQKCLQQTRLEILSQLLALAKATDIAIQGPLSGEKQDKKSLVDVRVLVHLISLVFAQIDNSVLEADEGARHVSSQLFECLLLFLHDADKTLGYQLCSGILPHFIVRAANGLDRLTSLWNLVTAAYQNNINIEMNQLNLALTVLCCFVGQFLGCSSDNGNSVLLELKTGSFFWSVIQDGLGHSDSLSRKRSSFLLQQSLKSVLSKKTDEFTTSDNIFWWKAQYESELKAIWEATVLLLETLEEKQVHIVKPVMTRLKVLIDATQTVIEGRRLLHFSWLCVIVKRAFVHESKTIIKWAVTDFLTMPMDNSPLKQQEFWPFLFKDLLSILSDSFLYTREQEAAIGSCSPISSSLVEFTTTLVQSISDDSKGEFLVGYIEAVTEHKMADVPLVFITYALSKIPPQPVVAGKFLAVVRELVLTCLDTHSIPMRAASQCFLLTTVINLSKEKELTYHDITTTLGVLKANECLSFDSVAWKQASGWLTSVTKQMGDSIVELLKNAIKGVINNDIDNSFKISHVARLLLLFIYSVSQDDSFFKFVAETEAGSTKELASSLISPVLDVIIKAHTHAYLSKTAVNNALELLVLMLRELPTSVTPLGSLLYDTIEPWIQEILSCVQRELLVGSRCPPFADLAYLNFFLDAWDTMYLLLEVNSSPLKSPVFTQIEAQCCVELNKAARTKTVSLVSSLHGAMSVASWLCKKKKNTSSNDPLLCCLSQLCLEVELLKPALEWRQSSDGVIEEGWDRRVEEMNKEWGPVVSHYLKCHWECVFYYKSLTAHLTPISATTPSPVTLGSVNVVQMAKACSESLDVGSGDIIVTICKCMTLLVPELYQVCRDDLYYHISILWKLTLEFKNKRKIFSDALIAFLSFAFHPFLFVVCSSSDEKLCKILQQVILECQELGEQKTGTFNVLVTHCCKVWLKAIVDNHSTSLQTSLICFSNLIKDALLFGPVYKRNLRVPYDVNCFIEALGDECSSNSLQLRQTEGDAHVRLTMILFLVQLAEKSKRDSQLGWVTQILLPHLIQLLLKKSQEEIASRPKCFINSLSHRIRTRLWQAVVMLLPFIDQLSTLENMLPAVFEATESGDQFSVRYLQEWAASYALAVHPSLLPMLWKYLENNTPSKFCLLVSVLTITVQIGRCLDNDDHKYDFLVKALPLVMKWTNCHHFMTKIYAQSALLFLWDLYTTYGKVDEQLNYLYPIVEFIRVTGDIARCRKRMSDNLFHSLCHAVKDLSFEAVYYIIPQSSQLTNEELIAKSDFEFSELCNNSLFIPVQCNNKLLCEAAAKAEEARQGKAGGDKSSPGMSDDVQKKITPWSSSSDTIMNELFPNQSDYPVVASTKKPGGGELILVASLLHKPPNLGGLCRTCEIFGVSQVVLNSTNIIEDSQFQALSVSAEKWVPIIQVRVSNLEEYLKNIKQQGYSLVGVEQTTQSKCLTSYRFPLKTVLLLGNEREGIPVHLIHMLDECVEIPQLGIIRSLNVHISGALLIWEYTKQHGFKTTE